jgi:hypothetical protein
MRNAIQFQFEYHRLGVSFGGFFLRTIGIDGLTARQRNERLSIWRLSEFGEENINQSINILLVETNRRPD